MEIEGELQRWRLAARGPKRNFLLLCEMTDALAIPMQPAGGQEGVQLFEATAVPCRRSGLHGYTVRVLPFHADEARDFLPRLIAWAEGSAHGSV